MLSSMFGLGLGPPLLSVKGGLFTIRLPNMSSYPGTFR